MFPASGRLKLTVWSRKAVRSTPKSSQVSRNKNQTYATLPLTSASSQEWLTASHAPFDKTNPTHLKTFFFLIRNQGNALLIPLQLSRAGRSPGPGCRSSEVLRWALLNLLRAQEER